MDSFVIHDELVFTARRVMEACALSAGGLVFAACSFDLGLGGGGSGIGPLPDPMPEGSPGEVRGTRLIPGEESVTVWFYDAPDADSYVLCFRSEPAPVFGDCIHEVSSPHTIEGLEPGVRQWFAVVPENEVGYGPVVETPSVVSGPAERPLAVYVDMQPEDLEELYSRPTSSDEHLPADLAVGDEVGPVEAVSHVRGIRFRGASSRRQDRKSFHIRLDSRPRLAEVPGFNFRGLGRRGGDRVLLNQTWTDPTGIRPALAFEMFEEVGLPAPTTFFADLWLNGVYEGFYVGVERVDREALRRWLLNRNRGEFTLVRDRARHRRDLDEIDLTSTFRIDPETFGETDEERIALLQQVFDYRGEAEDQDWAALLSLLRWVYDTEAGADWRRGFEERFHLDSVIDLLALYNIQDDFDSFADDYWLYRDDAGDGLWRIIPWDQERTFGNRFWFGTPDGDDTYDFYGDITDHFPNPLFDRTLESFADEIDARIREHYAETFTEAWFDERIEALAGQARAAMQRWPQPAFEQHPHQHKTEAGWFDWHIETLRDFQAVRRRLLTPERTGGEPYAFAGEVAFDEGGSGWVTDPNGWVLLRLEGLPGDALNLDVELRETPRDDGAQRDWVIENRGEPWHGRVTLYIRNRPYDTWLPELHEVGRAWELTIVKDGDTWIPTRVNPYSNAASAEVTLEGEQTLTLRFRR